MIHRMCKKLLRAMDHRSKSDIRCARVPFEQCPSLGHYVWSRLLLIHVEIAHDTLLSTSKFPDDKLCMTFKTSLAYKMHHQSRSNEILVHFLCDAAWNYQAQILSTTSSLCSILNQTTSTFHHRLTLHLFVICLDYSLAPFTFKNIKQTLKKKSK